jgi:hypothetical protein
MGTPSLVRLLSSFASATMHFASAMLGTHHPSFTVTSPVTRLQLSQLFSPSQDMHLEDPADVALNPGKHCETRWPVSAVKRFYHCVPQSSGARQFKQWFEMILFGLSFQTHKIRHRVASCALAYMHTVPNETLYLQECMMQLQSLQLGGSGTFPQGRECTSKSQQQTNALSYTAKAHKRVDAS